MSDIYRDSIFWVEVERIKPNPYQPRREFDQAKLEELADSIRMYGLLQPLTVTRVENFHDDGAIDVEYELIAGERRLRASKIAGLKQLPVIIRSGEDTDQMKLELAIIENLQREDLNPVDRAYAFERLFKEFGFTHTQIGKKVGKSREYVSNTLRILLLPEAVRAYLSEGRITEGHTRPILMLNNKPEEQSVLVKEILLKKLTVREAEALARRSAQEKVSAKHKIDPDILSMERALTEKLGTRVTIEPREVGGRLVISFFSAQDLQTLLDAIRVEDERIVATKVFDGLGSDGAALVGEEDEVADVLVATEAAGDGAQDEVQAVIVGEEPLREVGVEANTVSVTTDVSSGEQPRSTAAGVFDAILESIGAKKEEPAVEPAATVKQSEEVAETLEKKTEPVAVVTPSPKRPMPEEDNDLYSIRNFSI